MQGEGSWSRAQQDESGLELWDISSIVASSHWLEFHKTSTCLGRGVVSNRGLAFLRADGEPGPGDHGHPGSLNQAQTHLLQKGNPWIQLRSSEITYQDSSSKIQCQGLLRNNISKGLQVQVLEAVRILADVVPLAEEQEMRIEI